MYVGTLHTKIQLLTRRSWCIHRCWSWRWTWSIWCTCLIWLKLCIWSSSRCIWLNKRRVWQIKTRRWRVSSKKVRGATSILVKSIFIFPKMAVRLKGIVTIIENWNILVGWVQMVRFPHIFQAHPPNIWFVPPWRHQKLIFKALICAKVYISSLWTSFNLMH